MGKSNSIGNGNGRCKSENCRSGDLEEVGSRRCLDWEHRRFIHSKRQEGKGSPWAQMEAGAVGEACSLLLEIGSKIVAE